MVTEAIILSIDFNANSCVVRIPLFETANTVENFTATAKFAIQPGIYNGYNVGDTVWVSFITDKKETPLVIGKIYQGSDIEKEVKGGAVAAANLKVSDYATLPEGTQIDTSYTNFDTIKKIIENIKNIQENIDGENNSMDIYLEDEQQIGYWVDGKAIYRKAIRYVGDLLTNTEIEIGDIGTPVNDVIDIKQTATYGPNGTNRSTYDMYYGTTGSHTIIGCRVDRQTGKIYAQSCNDAWTNTTLIVIVEYTKA